MGNEINDNPVNDFPAGGLYTSDDTEGHGRVFQVEDADESDVRSFVGDAEDDTEGHGRVFQVEDADESDVRSFVGDAEDDTEGHRFY